MRPVNLLPQKHRPHQSDGSKSGSAYVIVGVLVVLLGMAVAYVLEANKISDAKSKTAASEQATAEARARAGVNGATWQTDAVSRFEERGSDRRRALHQMLELYAEHMSTNEPVHTWPLP